MLGAPLTIAERVKLALDKDHIAHGNTHFQTNPFDEAKNSEAINAAAQLQTNTRHGHVDMEGKEIKTNAPPTVNGFDFVKTPSPAPGVGESPLMTWGEIEGTPFRLDGSDTPLPSSTVGAGAFHLQPVSERDRIGLKLAEKVGKGYRDRRGRTKSNTVSTPYNPSHTPTPSKSAGTLRFVQISKSCFFLFTIKNYFSLQSEDRLDVTCCPSFSHV